MRKQIVRLDGLRAAGAGRGAGKDPWRFVLSFEFARGLAAVQGREGQAVLTPGEVADIVGAILALELDEESIKAVVIVMDVLRKMENKT